MISNLLVKITGLVRLGGEKPERLPPIVRPPLIKLEGEEYDQMLTWLYLTSDVEDVELAALMDYFYTVGDNKYMVVRRSVSEAIDIYKINHE